MTIYTGRGDEGDTDLRDMSRVSKASPRIEGYGTVDEANALIGTVRPTGRRRPRRAAGDGPESSPRRTGRPRNPDPDPDDPAVEARARRDARRTHRRARRGAGAAALVHSPRRRRGGRPAPSRPHGDPPSGASSRRTGALGTDQREGRHLPQPTLRLAVHARSRRERARRRARGVARTDPLLSCASPRFFRAYSHVNANLERQWHDRSNLTSVERHKE